MAVATASLLHANGCECVAEVSASSADAMLLDMRRQRAQTAEDALVIRIIRTQAETVFLGHGQRKFECVDRIETKVAAEQTCFRIDVSRFYPVDIEAFDEQRCELLLGGRLRGSAGWRFHKQWG